MELKDNLTGQADEQQFKSEEIGLISSILLSIISIVGTFAPITNFPPFLLPMVSGIAIIVFYFQARFIFTNALLFSILWLLLSVVLPLSHYGIYKVSKSSYKFEKDFLMDKTSQTRENLKQHIELGYINQLLYLKSDTILTEKLENLGRNKIFFVDNFLIKFESVEDLRGRHPSQKEVIGFYTNQGDKLGIVDTEDCMTINDAIQREASIISNLQKDLQTPDENILVDDFWVESITGFAFSHIKPISFFAKFIRLVQIVIAFLFLAMITNTLRQSGKFELKKIQY